MLLFTLVFLTYLKSKEPLVGNLRTNFTVTFQPTYQQSQSFLSYSHYYPAAFSHRFWCLSRPPPPTTSHQRNGIVLPATIKQQLSLTSWPCRKCKVISSLVCPSPPPSYWGKDNTAAATSFIWDSSQIFLSHHRCYCLYYCCCSCCSWSPCSF